MNVVLPSSIRFQRTPMDMHSGRAVGSLAAPQAWRRPANLRGFRGEPPEQFYASQDPLFASTAAIARTLGYSLPFYYDVANAGGILYVNPDGTVNRMFNATQWPLPVSTVPAGGANTGFCLTNYCVWDTSFVAPPQSVWNQYLATVTGNPAQQAIAQQNAAAAANAIAAAQQDCAAAGGTWNPWSNSCRPGASAAATLTAQQACLARNLPWNTATGACGAAPVNSTAPLKYRHV